MWDSANIPSHKTAIRKILLATNRPTQKTVFAFLVKPEKSLTTKNAKTQKDCGCELHNSNQPQSNAQR